MRFVKGIILVLFTGLVFTSCSKDSNPEEDILGIWEVEGVDFEAGDDSIIAEGGAAATAYARLQFEQMDAQTRERIKSALLRYCELDTLAMVRLWEVFRGSDGGIVRSRPRPVSGYKYSCGRGEDDFFPSGISCSGGRGAVPA